MEWICQPSDCDLLSIQIAETIDAIISTPPTGVIGPRNLTEKESLSLNDNT